MQAKFTQGPILNHIFVMTLSGTIGLIALFLVDLLDVYFLNLLGIIEITAAVGFAGSILFFTISVGIGLSIGCGARVSQVVGKGDKEVTRRVITHNLVTVAAITTPLALALYLLAPTILDWLGAQDQTKQYALDYICIILPTLPLLSMAMAFGGTLRALGEAKRSMWLTLIGALVNAILDPLFIFALDGGIQGAAWATVAARIGMFSYGAWAVAYKQQLLGPIEKRHLKADRKQFYKIAVPAMLTNLSTPIAFAFITAVMATFGDEAIAGSAMVTRIQQVAFAGLFALSGAIGPIAGQNLGAEFFDRIHQTLNKSLQFILIYCALVCTALFALTPALLFVFQAQGLAADIIVWFCYGFSLTYIFNGITFVCNAMLNNLHAAHVSTQFNFAKATLGTMPFVYLGAYWAGPIGIFWGVLIGAAVIAILGIIYTHRHITKLANQAIQTEPEQQGLVD